MQPSPWKRVLILPDRTPQRSIRHDPGCVTGLAEALSITCKALLSLSAVQPTKST